MRELGWLAFLLGLLLSSFARASSIGIFADAAATSCNLDTPPGSNEGTVYICATDVPPPSPETGEMRGAEFRVEGLSNEWTASWTPAPASAWVEGDPFGDGATIGFDVAQSGSSVLLFTAALTLPAPGSQAIVHVTTSRNPSPPWITCPVIIYFQVEAHHNCVTGGSLSVNSEAPCSVAVEAESWSQVKELYR